jgi:acetolactate synthase-1/2/3 large subunit
MVKALRLMLDLAHVVYDIAEELTCAQRPVFIFGWGIHLAGAEDEAKTFARMGEIPILATWGAADLPNYGTFGTHGNKYANLAVQNADYIVCVGSRLDTKATGSPASSFAPKAKIVMVDVDRAELGKMQMLRRPLHRAIQADAKIFLGMLLRSLEARWQAEESWSQWKWWNAQLLTWKSQYPAVPYGDPFSPYLIVQELGKHIKADDVIVSDTGCALAWMMQAYPFKGERFVHAFNSTPMGYGLPAAIGACFATGRRVVLVTGDGGLSVNITEMATAVGHKLPIKVILFANGSHSMCMQTQRQWLGGEYPSTTKEGGLSFPDFEAVAKAYGFACPKTLEEMFSTRGPSFLQFQVDREQGVHGQIKFGEPLAA